MRNLRLRAAGAAVVITMTMVISQAFAPAVQASAANGSQTFTFSGSVSQTGVRWVRNAFPVSSTGTITAQLSWPTAGVNLNLFLEDTSGKIVKCDCSQTPNASSITWPATVTGDWWIAVKAVSGDSTYSVVVTAPSSSSSPTTTPSPTTSPTPPPTQTDFPTVSYGGGVPTWDAGFMEDGIWGTKYDVGLTAAVQAARTFDVIVAPWALYDKYVAQMKAANPNLLLFIYLQGMYPSSNANNYVNSYYAHDTSGNKILDRAFGTYLMDPASTGWRDQLIANCQDKLVQSGYDGCFLDSMGAAGTNENQVTAPAVDPTTGQPYTKSAWFAATASLAGAVRAAVAPHLVIGNGLAAGFGYFSSDGASETLLNGLAGGMSEIFVRSPTQSVTSFRNETQWKQDVDMLAEAASRPSGNVVFTTTKVWVTASAAQIDQWHRYALATFLLGYVPGHAFFTFLTDKNMTQPNPYWNVAIGDPIGAYVHNGSIYQRDFQFGRVLVNPTSSSVTVNLGGSFQTLSGDVVSSLTMAPHTGEVLTSSLPG